MALGSVIGILLTLLVVITSKILQGNIQPKVDRDRKEPRYRRDRQVELAVRESEEKFRQLAENIQEVFYICSFTSKEMLYISPAYEQIWGQSCESLYQNPQSWFDQIYPEDRTRMQAAVERMFAGQALKEEYRIIRPDGKIRWIFTKNSIINNQDGEPYRIVGVAQDISDRKQTELALQKSEQRYRSLITATAQVVWSADPQGAIVEVLTTWSEYTGQNFQEYCGWGWTEAIHPDDRDRHTLAWQNAVESQTSYRSECRIKSKDGDYRYFLVKGVPIIGENGKVREWVGTCTDISDRQQALEKVKQLNDELEKRVIERTVELETANSELITTKAAAEAASETKSQFLANISHELRTPLNGILGYTQILQRDRSLNNQQQQSLNIIHECSEHLLSLINDVLSLAKIEANKMELLPKAFNFANFSHSIIKVCRLSAENKGLKWIYRQSPDLETQICLFADERLLRQVLLNLLGNAIKFTTTGSVTWEIQKLPSNTQYIYLRFIIQDTGIGIAKNKIEKIFQPFEQAGSREQQLKGTGLGLTISQKIIRMMDSQIKIESQPNQGSKFWFDLKLPLANYCPPTYTSDSRQIIGIKNNSLRVLVVDDNWQNLSFLLKFLISLGIKVAAAKNGEEGLAKLTKFQPDLIVTDLVMPVMDGFEMIRRIRNNEQDKNIKIIAISASAFETDKSQSFAAGSDAFLTKPIQLHDFLANLQKLLDLDFIYSETKSETTSEKTIVNQAKHSQLIPPPQSEIKLLYELARKGDILSIRQQAEQIKQINSDYLPFVEIILNYASNFQSKEIRNFLEQYQQQS